MRYNCLIKNDDRKQVEACQLYRELPVGERRKSSIALNTFHELRAEGFLLCRLCRGHPLQSGYMIPVKANGVSRL